ncbi:MAG TPA: BON domain-containing protein [Thermoanaerobaculia bacterium]
MRLKTVRGIVLAWVALLSMPAGATAQKTLEVRRLELKIQEALVARLGEDARPIQVALNGRKAFLSGTVDERVTQELAKEVVLSFDEVDSATNRIEARKTPTIAEGQAFLEGQDVEVEFRVNRAMSAALGKLAKAINVEVVDGVASLRGPVPDATTHELAVTTAKGVAGVRQILDLLKRLS